MSDGSKITFWFLQGSEPEVINSIDEPEKFDEATRLERGCEWNGKTICKVRRERYDGAGGGSEQ